jgi:hypothetical protein
MCNVTNSKDVKLSLDSVTLDLAETSLLTLATKGQRLGKSSQQKKEKPHLLDAFDMKNEKEFYEIGLVLCNIRVNVISNQHHSASSLIRTMCRIFKGLAAADMVFYH